MQGLIVRRQIRNQNHFAAIIIQKCCRGYICRKRLWSYGGEWYVYYVIKVQCAYRIRLALKAVVKKWQDKVSKSVHQIHSLFYYWKARKIRHKIHAAFMKKCVIKLQSAYRRKIAKRLFYIVKTIHRNKMALRLQCFIRRFIGYRRALHRKRLKNYLLHHFVQKHQTTRPDEVAISSGKMQRSVSMASVMTASSQHEPIINFRNQSCTEAVTKFCGIIYDIAIKAEFTKAYHKAQQIITHEYVKRNLEDLPNNSFLNKKPTKRLSAISTVSSIDMESMNLMPDDGLESLGLIQSMPIPTHLKRFLVEYLLYLPHTTNWSKFGRTRQLHISLLERWFGYISQKVMSAVDKEVYSEALENTRKKRKSDNHKPSSEGNEQQIDQHGIPTVIEIGGGNGKVDSKMEKVSGSASGSVKSSSMSTTIQPFSSKQSITANSSAKAVIAPPVSVPAPVKTGIEQSSPWNMDSIKVIQRKDSINTINTLSRHPSESSVRSSSSRSKGAVDSESLSAVFHPKNQRVQTPPVGMINSTFAALKEKDQFIELKRRPGNRGKGNQNHGSISRCASTRSRTATMETIEEMSLDDGLDSQGQYPESDQNPQDRFKNEQPVILFPDPTIRLEDSFTIDEVIDMFFQVTSLSYYSYLKSFDACMLKIDMLLFYAFHRLSHIVNDNNLPLEQDGDELDDGTITDWQTLEDDNDPMLEGIPRISAGNKENEEIQTTTEYNYFLPFFCGFEKKDKTLKKLLTRAMKLMNKAKSMAVVGSLEEFELHFRFDFFHSLNSMPIVLYEVKKEFFVKIVNVGSIGGKDGQQQQDTTMNDKLPQIPKPAPGKGKGKKSNRPKTTSGEDITITATVRVILSGAIVYVTGTIEKLEDIVAPPVHQQTAICIRLVEYFKNMSGVKLPVAGGIQGSSSQSRSNSFISKTNSNASSAIYTRQSSFLSQQSSVSGENNLDNESVTSSIYEEEAEAEELKSQFPLVIRPMVLFHQEVYQLIALFKANYVESDDEDDDEDIQDEKKVVGIDNNKKKTVHSNSNNKNQNNQKRNKKKKKHRKNNHDSRTVEGFHQLTQRFSQLDDMGEEFVEYLVQKELHLSLIYQFHVLANQVSTSSMMMMNMANPNPNPNPNSQQGINTTMTGGSVISAVTTASLAASLTIAATHGSSAQPLVIADNIEPVIQFRIPFLDSKRRQLLANNDIRYATMVLQRIYRGFIGRKRFKYVYKKKQEILRRRWLAWKVLDKLKIMRQKHERMAIRIQANVKGWLWRKQLKKMNQEVVKIQCLIRRKQAKKKVDNERKRRQGGPQVIDMIPAGRIVTVHERRLQMKIYRSGGNFKFRGIDLIHGEIYYGVCYQQDIKKLLQGYNEIIKCEYEARGELITSVACKNDQIFSWQYEKITDFICKHLDFIHTIHPVTNTFFLLPGEEQDEFNRKNDFMLVVRLETSEEIYDKIQSKTLHLLHGNKDDIMSHSFLPYLKKIIHEDGKKMRLLGNSKNRKNLIRGFNASNQRKNNSNNRRSVLTIAATPAAASSAAVEGNMMTSSSQRVLPTITNGSATTNLSSSVNGTSMKTIGTNNNANNSSKLMMAGKLSLQSGGIGGNLGGIR